MSCSAFHRGRSDGETTCCASSTPTPRRIRTGGASRASPTAARRRSRRNPSAPEERSLIAHIRLATIGHIEYENCHPFTAADNSGRTWTLAHNGTIFSGTALNDYMGIQYGDTDSERVLLHLIDRINVAQNHRRHALDEAERFGVLSAAIAELAKGNKLNLLIYDGEVLYAHCNFRDTLHVWRDVDAVMFSTRPLSMGTWVPVPFTSLVAAKDGEIVRTSPPHGNEYIYNPEDYRLVYMNFARL